MIDQKIMQGRMDASRKEGFERWLKEPLVVVLLSMIPPADHTDLLRKLLQAAYDAGHHAGQGAVLLEVIGKMGLPPEGYRRG